MRRANGTGTVVKLPGNRRQPYQVKISYHDEFGQLKQKPYGYYAKAAEAQAALEEYNRKKALGQAPKPGELSITVQQVYDAWSERTYKKLEAKGSKQSIVSHKASWKKRVSVYADRKFRDVALDEWQAILDRCEEEDLSQSTINNAAILIKALHSYCMERDIIGKDYSQFLDIPTVDIKNPRGALNDLQLQQLSDLAASGFPWADTALMLCYTGFRVNAFLDLTPMSYHPNGQYLYGGNKSENGKNRIVPVHPRIRPYLERWLAKGGENIICLDHGKRPSYSFFRTTVFPPVMERLGMSEATPHWCRHTFSTRLYAAEVEELTIKWLMGHSTKSDVTAGYTHPELPTLTAAVRKLA